MKILAIGDIFAECGMEHLKAVLRGVITDEGVDFCVANGENASGTGISTHDYNELCDAGVDAITLGNHTFRRKDVINLLENETNIIRPANYPSGTAGGGSVIIGVNGVKVGIINIMGRLNIDIALDCPFKVCDREIERIGDSCDIILVDFHAESTSEKRAMLFYLDGRVSALWGTHTHVQTADEQTTRRGTGYITDLGMTGCEDSVLGVQKDIIVERFTTAIPRKFEYAYGRAMLCGAVFDIDEANGKCRSVKRICVR